jgi:hypothetical protein
MTMQNEQMLSQIADVRQAAHRLEDAIYALAQQAMKDSNPHMVAFTMREHDKVHRIARTVATLYENIG